MWICTGYSALLLDRISNYDAEYDIRPDTMRSGTGYPARLDTEFDTWTDTGCEKVQISAYAVKISGSHS